MLEARHGYIKWENCKVTFNTILKKKKRKNVKRFFFLHRKRLLLSRYYPSIFRFNLSIKLSIAVAREYHVNTDWCKPPCTNRSLVIYKGNKKEARRTGSTSRTHLFFIDLSPQMKARRWIVRVPICQPFILLSSAEICRGISASPGVHLCRPHI